MNLEHIINSWRDAEFCENLDEQTRATMPDSPIGEIHLDDADLEGIRGGNAEGTTGGVWCWVSSILTNLCISIVYGGTCENDTTGCCEAAQ
ncbi:MAG TPA: mersacidin/lichenicidin family type 2 lantibiotic [Ktedonobacteraceae bacterium]|nr:mersacidin/lichenicidin family type 2 lantibiotic [Ktedonobacteraceae bacterium]